MKKQEYYHDCVKEIGDEFVIVEKKYILEKGKTTTKGEYPKLNSDDKCNFPERATCNDGEFFIRCPFMKYHISQSSFNSSRWKCTFVKNQVKDFKNNELNNNLKEKIK